MYLEFTLGSSLPIFLLVQETWHIGLEFFSEALGAVTVSCLDRIPLTL